MAKASTKKGPKKTTKSKVKKKPTSVKKTAPVQTGQSSTVRLLVLAAMFGFIGVGLLAAISARSNSRSVSFDSKASSSLSTRIDGSANGGTFVQFSRNQSGGGGSLGGGGNPIIERTSLPVRNTVFDNQQYSDLPAAEIPIGPSNSFVTASPRITSEFGPGARGPFDNQSALRTWCSYSHLSYDDPVVFPGQTGAAHLHMFFGNTLANANSTGRSLIDAGASTCDGGPLNRTSYWIPAMMDGNGNVVIPRWMFIYYKTFDLKTEVATPPINQSEAFPEGLGFVSKGEGSPPNIDYWCGPVTLNTTKSLHRKTIPDCGGRMTQRVRFPFCWDGRLNSDDNSHMVMPIGDYGASICPSTHQRRIPHIEYQLEYTIAGNSSNWHLSSDIDAQTGQKTAEDGSTGHGDWFNGWNPEVNKIWNRDCTRALFDCHQNVFNPTARHGFLYHNKSRFNGAGSNIIPASEINKICPGDVDRGPYDGAYCSSALRANASLSADGHAGHSHGPDADDASFSDALDASYDRIRDSYLDPVQPTIEGDYCTEILVDGVCTSSLLVD